MFFICCDILKGLVVVCAGAQTNHLIEGDCMRECFIITPIGHAGSETRRETDGLVKSVFFPVLKSFDFDPIPAHQISETGSITRQIIKRIIESDLVIANLTELNPNVMYEVGVRHCARKPMIVVAKEGTILPFDLSDERTIFFRNDMIGSEELKNMLREMIPKALEEVSPDNPVYRVVDLDLIKFPEEISDVAMLSNKRYSQIEDQLEDIQTAIRSISISTLKPVSGSPRDGLSRFMSRSSGCRYVFSCYLYEDDSGVLETFIKACEKIGVAPEVTQVAKHSMRFTAYCKTKEQISELEDLAAELNIRTEFMDFVN